ncbi:MAG: DUF6782 family putative metallopeptidase [Acidobacteriota bacterium]
MRRKYNTLLAAILLAIWPAFADPCPPSLTAAARDVARLRSVGEPFAPPCRVIHPPELRAELDRKLRRDLPLSPELFVEALWRLGYIDRAEGVYQKLLDFYISQVLGFYEPATNEMVVVRHQDTENSAARSVWVHELAHAAQEHRFRLPTRLLAMRDNGDAQRAASAIAEGDATLVMFLLGPGPEALDAAEAALRGQSQALPRPEGLPEYFVADLVFPYAVGFSAVRRAYEVGGWAAVDRLLATPSPSTAALLHPGRPQAAPVPDRDLPAVPIGWREVIADTVGEWGLSFWLGRRMPRDRAEALAAGWNGDRFRVIRSVEDPGRWALAMRIRARGPGEAETLVAALSEHASSLLRNLSAVSPGIAATRNGVTIELRANWPEPR